MPRTKKPAPLLPETATMDQIASLVGLKERRVYQLAETGVIPRPVDGSVPLAKTILAIIEDLRQQASGQSADKARDQARQAKADADRAEMAAAKDAGTLMLTADAKRMWSDGFVKIRDVVVRSTLTAKQKKELTEKMQKIKVEQS